MGDGHALAERPGGEFDPPGLGSLLLEQPLDRRGGGGGGKQLEQPVLPRLPGRMFGQRLKEYGKQSEEREGLLRG